MKLNWKQGVAGILAALALMPGAQAAGGSVKLNGTTLSAQEAWIENGTSYITLAAFARETGRTLRWDGKQAILEGNGLELTAAPGAIYILSNDRGLYVAEGVRVVEGRTVLSLRLLSQATSGALSWDAASGTAHLDTRGTVPAQADYDEEDLYWMSRIISAESRGEPLLGQIAVGNVVLNRVADKQFPNAVKEVIFDDKYAIQFEPVENGTVYDEPTDSAVLAAKISLEGADVIGRALYFYAPKLSPVNWINQNRPFYMTIGCHDFHL